MEVGRENSLNQLTLDASTSENVKPARKKRPLLDGRTFKAFLKTQLSPKAAADKNGINSCEKDAIAKETLANAEKLIADSYREKQLPAHEVANVDLRGRSHDDIECGNSAALSKRKRDLDTDLDASALDAKRGYCTFALNELHSSSGCKPHNVFETCDECFKKRRVDHDAHGPDFCSCSSVLVKDSPETNIHEDTGQLEASVTTEYAEKLDSRDQLKESHLEILTEATESRCIICKRGGRLIDSINIDVPEAESSDVLGKIRERFSRCIPCECKSSSSKFIEFWVPCVISNVQLEQYCHTLLSNSILLRLHSKNDRVGSLRDAVFSTRKSCDHPYIVDPSLKLLITKDLPPINFLDVGIKASGKLQLLEMILSEIKRRQLRVLILFQSVAGSGRDTFGLGDVLDDFLREKFGVGNYERLDGGAVTSKSRQKALNNFNKESERFVFLLENRACLPSIKLLSVDTIIIFDSDWNPGNDVKALNRISIDSQFKQIKIFRLYSVFTVEEQVLILAKQGLTFESNLENLCRDTSNTLLMWGASCLFSRLDEFHRTPNANVLSENTLSSKVVNEILMLLSQTGECDNIDNSHILKVQHNGGIYKSAQKLLGEQQVQLSADEPPHILWTNLLSQRNPKWKFISSHTQRHRKKVKYSEDSPKKAECEAVEVEKKRKKGGANGNDSPRKPVSEAVEVGKKHGMEGAICINTMSRDHGLERDNDEGGESCILEDNGSCCLKRPDVIENNSLDTTKVPMVFSEKSMLPDVKKNLHLSVKPDVLKLCEILKLSDEVKIMVEKFLVYVFSNHQVKSDSTNILQAFLLSLCWSSASLLNQKVDRKECLVLAKQHLKFSCSGKEADSVYSAVQKLEKTFKKNILSDLSEDGLSGDERFHRGTLNEKMMQSQNVNVKPDLEEIGDQIRSDGIAQADETHKVDADNKLKLVQRKCSKRIAKLKKKQEDEIKELNSSWDVRVVDIEDKQKVGSAIIRELYNHNKYVKMDKLKILDLKCRKNIEELEREKEISIKELRAKHLDVLSDESRKVARWLKSVTSFATEASGQDEPQLHHSSVTNEVGDSQADKHGSLNVSENVATLPRHADDVDTKIVGVVPDNACITDPNQGVRCNSLNEIVAIAENPNLKDDEVHNMSSVNGLVAKNQQPKGLGSSINACESTASISLYHSENQNPDQIICSEPGKMFLTEPVRRIPEEIIGNASASELRTPAAEFHEENYRIGAQNILINHFQSGDANSSVGVDSPSTVMPENQPSSSTVCNHVKPPALQLLDAEKDDQPNFNTARTEDRAHDEQSQLEHSMDSLLGHSPTDLPHTAGSAPKPLIERDPPQCDEAFQLNENATVLSGLAFSLIDQNVEENPQEDNQERHLAAKKQPDTPQQLVEHAVELPNQVLLHPGSNGERSSPTGVIETPLQHHHPNLPSTSTLDLEALNLDRSLMNFEAVTQVNESATRIPRQAVISNRVAMPVEGLNNPQLCAQYHDPSQIPELTSYIDPLQNELEGIRKETEQAIKFYEDTKMRLKTELEEFIAQTYREYKAKHKDVEAAFLRTKKELEENHNKVLINKILASTFRSKCMENYRFMGMQQQDVPPGLSQHLNQFPLHGAARSSSTDVASSSGQPATCQHNTSPMLQPTSRVYPNNVSSTVSQPAASHQNMTVQSQPGMRLSPFTAPSSSRQRASNQQRTTLLLQPENFVNNFASFSSSAGQSAASQQNIEKLLQPSIRIPPISVSSSAARPASSQQSTPPLQIVHQSSALFSNSPTRPPHINLITPLTGNLRVGNDNRGRAPAPHLQALRSASSSFSSMIPSHLPASDRPTSSSDQLLAKAT